MLPVKPLWCLDRQVRQCSSVEESSESACWRVSEGGRVQEVPTGVQAIAKCSSCRTGGGCQLHCCHRVCLLQKEEWCRIINCFSSSPLRWPRICNFYYSHFYLHLIFDKEKLLAVILLWLQNFHRNALFWKIVVLVVPLDPRLRHIGLLECLVKCQYYHIASHIILSFICSFNRW